MLCLMLYVGRVRALLVLAALGAVATAAVSSDGDRGGRYTFYREEGGARSGSAARRVFGGRAAELSAWGAVCALLDRYWATRCSGAVLAPRWVLTAAHCVSPRLAYVKYNARWPSAADGDAVPVHYLYRHPRYEVQQSGEPSGPDVMVLRHDVGLLRTRADMRLDAPPELTPLHAIWLYEPLDFLDEEVEVLGFGRSAGASSVAGGTYGEELRGARLRLARCVRNAWQHCACGVGAGGVCAGDSGGPVVLRGALVAVTSLGPAECAEGALGAATSSVFTALRRYAPLVNATVHEAEAALRMTRVSAATRVAALGALCALALLVAV